MKKAKIEVDIVGQMNLFRTATFPSKYPIIKEAIQNGQRSKGVTLMEFWVSDSEVRIMDNGAGLSDPRDLLTIAKSGWDEETKKEQNPFGLGFFSCVKTFDTIIVESNNLRMTIHVPKILQGDPTVDVEELEIPVRGFTLILRDPVNSLSSWEIERAVREVAQYITQFEVQLNSYPVDSRSYTEPDGSKFARKVSNHIYSGWLRPYGWGDDYNLEFRSDGVKIFYQDRLVKQLNNIEIAGCVGVYNHQINLRAPDREDFIYDDKHKALKDQVEADFKPILIDILQRGTDSELKKYEQHIDRRMEPFQYAQYLKYTIVYDPTYLEKLAGMTKDELKNLTPEKLAEMIEPPQTEPPPVIETDSIQPMIPKKRQDPGIIEGPSSRGGEELPTIGTHQMIYYLSKDEIVDYVNILKKALEHNIPIIIVKNSLEEKAIRLREDIIHVSELTQVVNLKAKLKSAGAKDMKEKRAMMLFNLISKILDLDKNPFVIGDIEALQITNFGPVEIESKYIEPFGLANREHIMIDRSKLNKSTISESTIRKVLPSDLQFIAVNLDTIAHELTHYIYDTDDDTGAHFKLQLEVTDKILQKLFSPDFNFKDI